MTAGIDLAKNVFSLHGVDENGKVALRCPVRRDHQLLELIAPKFVTTYCLSGRSWKSDAADATAIRLTPGICGGIERHLPTRKDKRGWMAIQCARKHLGTLNIKVDAIFSIAEMVA